MEPVQYSNGICDVPPQTGKEETPHVAEADAEPEPEIAAESTSVASLNVIVVTGVTVAFAGIVGQMNTTPASTSNKIGFRTTAPLEVFKSTCLPSIQ